MILQAMLAGRRGQFGDAEAHAEQAERLLLSPGANFWRALLQDARGNRGARRRAARRGLRAPAACLDAGRSGIQHGHAVLLPRGLRRSRGVLAARRSPPQRPLQMSSGARAPWPCRGSRMVLSYSRALLAAPGRAEQSFQDALGANAQSWPFRRGCCLLAYGAWLRRQRRIMDARAPLRGGARQPSTPSARRPGATARGANCAPRARAAARGEGW